MTGVQTCALPISDVAAGAGQTAAAGTGFLQYFFPGSIVMVVLFTSIFSNMSTIEDRRDGYLMSMLASPMPRVSIVLGKILGGTTQAMIPGMLFVLLAPLAGLPLSAQSIGKSAFILFLTAFSLNGFGFLIAWQMESTQGFHAVLNLLLMPMWIDRKSTRLNSSHIPLSRMPSSA